MPQDRPCHPHIVCVPALYTHALHTRRRAHRHPFSRCVPRAPAQNFGACLELAKKKSRKAYGEKKEAFNTLKGLSGRYIYAAEAASKGIDVFDHLM